MTINPETRTFHLGTVLSITTEKLVSPDRIGGVYEILNYMTGDNLFTHQIPRATRECAPELIAQHPWLAGINPPEFTGPEHAERWLGAQVSQYGASVEVAPVGPGVHKHVELVEEFIRMRQSATGDVDGTSS